MGGVGPGWGAMQWAWMLLVVLAGEPRRDRIGAMAVAGLRPAVGLGWSHSISRHISLGVEVEGVIQPRGFWQLVGLSQRARIDVWPLARMRRLHVGGGLAIIEQIFAYEPSLLDVAIAPTFEVGWSFVGRRGLFFDLSLGLRTPLLVHDEPVVCRGPKACHATTDRVQPRAVASVGYAF